MDSTEYSSESLEINTSQSEIMSNSESCIEVENKDNAEKSIEVEIQNNTKSHVETEAKDNTESCAEEETKDNSDNYVQEQSEDNLSFVGVETKGNNQRCAEEETKDNIENYIEVGTKDNIVSCVEETRDNTETYIEEQPADSSKSCIEKETEDNIKSCVEEENKDDTESCIEKTLEEEKTSDKPSFDKNVNDETSETTVATLPEIDPPLSHIDSAVSAEAIVEDVETGMKVSSSEKTNTIDAMEESNEHLSKEDTSVNADKETEPSTSDLTETCDMDQSVNVENVDETDLELPNVGIITEQNSCNVTTEQNTDSTDCVESTNDEIANEIEMLASDNKENNGTDESSVNVDDMQMDQKEADASKQKESESSNSNKENTDKDISEKNIEPENTEFVQFSQDKHDSQIEGQSMDAEDPFGGDNLTSENVEQMGVANLADDEINFKNLYNDGDNLQDAVSAKNNVCNKKSGDDSGVEKIMTNIADTSTKVRDILGSSSIEVEPSDATESETGADKMSVKSTKKQDEQTKKDTKAAQPMETDEEHGNTDVLPGQDDELCIIPDSIKVIMPNKATSSKESSKKLDKDSGVDKTTEKCSKFDSGLNKDNVSEREAVSTTKQIAIIKEAMATEKLNIVTDIITVEEETKTSEVEEIPARETCKQCGEERACKIQVKDGTETYRVCSKTCKALFRTANKKTVDVTNNDLISSETSSKRDKRCAYCLLIIDATDDRNLSWETMEFCNEECLGKFQKKYGSFCKNCNGAVQPVSLGKYCVRFGCDVKQFCCSTCLEEFKKGLKVCSYCQKDISFSKDGFLAPVGEKGQFKDFCTQDCMEKYSKLNSTEPPAAETKPCSVCKEEKPVHCEVQIYNSIPVAICSEPCFAAFKFVKQVNPEQCSTCKKFFELPNKQHFIVFYENEPHTFCNKTCLNIFIITNRKIVPCNWCKVKKYNFDMIKKELKHGQNLMMCSLNCLTLYQVSMNAVSAKRINCDCCKEYSLAHYHLTMSDATIRNFCSYNCVMNFQAQYTKSPITIPSGDDPVPTGAPKKTTLPLRGIVGQTPGEMQGKKTMPVISSVTSLATMPNGQASPTAQQNNIPTQMIYNQQIITRPASPVHVHNKTTQCKPLVHTKGVNVRPHPCTRGTQTSEKYEQTTYVPVPIPVPIYVPYPMHMYSVPFPVPMPFPLPIPVPIFIPTTRNSYKGIMKDIKKIQEKIPSDPYEAELLMMAEMVATEKKTNDSDSDLADDREADQNNDDSGPEADSNAFEDDVLQMALKMATEDLDEPAVDLEAALTPNTITATQAPAQPENIDNDVQSERLMIPSRGRKRVVPYKPRSTPKRRRVSGTNEMPLMPPPKPQLPPQPRIIEPIEKPDANMTLKYTFGVNAWRQWVIGKNAELEKQMTAGKKTKLFKTDLLQLTADELNYSLCLFLKEVRKPNGTEYAPDTIYYLCLGIQQYLIENNRIDNIFTDSYYERFTDCLNEIAKKFSVIYNDAQYIVTRVEEEHLWECKQLGAHSPHVLLSTLMYFNTKHFNLVTVEEHMQLSFSHIMKHWKRNPAAQPTAVTGKGPGTRNVLLRFYPPQSALEANSRKKKVYEQQENEENPLRCPVKLYEFYLSKCPESVKTRNDVFYLLPERSCVPDSPVWYSTSPLAKEHLIKTLYRIKMVKEINVALLTS